MRESPMNPSPTTKPVTLIPNSSAAVKRTIAQRPTPAILNRKFSRPSSKSTLSSSFLRYPLTMLIIGIPMTSISTPEAGPEDRESERQEKLGSSSLGKSSRHPLTANCQRRRHNMLPLLDDESILESSTRQKQISIPSPDSGITWSRIQRMEAGGPLRPQTQ